MSLSPVSESIGRQLLEARTRKGLSIEDVAFRTHIPAVRVAELENDDFSNFANLTYAKGFLKIYSNFLDLDISGYLEEFDTKELAAISGHDFILSNNTGVSSMSSAVATDKGGGRWKGAALLTMAVILGIGAVITSKFLKSEPTPATSKPSTPPPKAKPVPDAGAVAKVSTPEPLKPADSQQDQPAADPPAPDTTAPKTEPSAKPPKARPILPAVPANENVAPSGPPPAVIEVKPAVSPPEND